MNLNKGIAGYLDKNYPEAVSSLERAIAENPQSAVAHHALGLSLYKMERDLESIKYLERAKSLDPNIMDINLDLGAVYLKTGDLAMAEAEFTEAVTRNPKSGLAQYNLGYTQYQLGKYQASAASLDKAAGLDSEVLLPSKFYKGASHYQIAEYQTAKTDFETVRTLQPETSFAKASIDYLAAIERLTKKYYGLVSVGAQFDDNVSLEPNDVEITDQSDVRGVFIANLGFKPYLKPDAVIGLDYKTYFSFHNDLDEFNIQDHRFGVYGEKRVTLAEKLVSFRLDYAYDVVLIDGSPASDLFSQYHLVSPKITVKWSNITSTDLSYQLRFDDFEDFPERDAVNNAVVLAQTFLLRDGKLLIRPGVKFEINSADDIAGRRNFDYYAPGVFVEGFLLLPYDLVVFSDASYSREDYHNDPFERVDNELRFRVVVSKKVYKNLSVDFGYQHISNLSDSDVPAGEPFDYSRNVVSATLSVRF
ncbi:MAG: tetratricopeptide repeat protein [Deltaproteobacteria bacterium]